MRKIALLTASASMIAAPMAFANNAKSTAATDAKTPTDPAASTETKSKADRVNPEITAISSVVPMPARPNNRGSKSAFDFDALEVGQSFGVKNITAAKMAPKVSRANRLAMTNKVDANGAVVYKTQELTGADGAKTTVPTNEAVKVPGKVFFAVDVDATTDPDGAICRVFREK